MLPKLPHMPATIVLPAASSNIAYLQALQSISVALQSARAHSISVAREFLTLDSPYSAGPLPQVPPPSSPARLLVPRFYALNPTPALCPYLTLLSKSPSLFCTHCSLQSCFSTLPLTLNPSLLAKKTSIMKR